MDPWPTQSRAGCEAVWFSPTVAPAGVSFLPAHQPSRCTPTHRLRGGLAQRQQRSICPEHWLAPLVGPARWPGGLRLTMTPAARQWVGCSNHRGGQAGLVQVCPDAHSPPSPSTGQGTSSSPPMPHGPWGSTSLRRVHPTCLGPGHGPWGQRLFLPHQVRSTQDTSPSTEPMRPGFGGPAWWVSGATPTLGTFKPQFTLSRCSEAPDPCAEAAGLNPRAESESALGLPCDPAPPIPCLNTPSPCPSAPPSFPSPPSQATRHQEGLIPLPSCHWQRPGSQIRCWGLGLPCLLRDTIQPQTESSCRTPVPPTFICDTGRTRVAAQTCVRARPRVWGTVGQWDSFEAGPFC